MPIPLPFYLAVPILILYVVGWVLLIVGNLVLYGWPYFLIWKFPRGTSEGNSIAIAAAFAVSCATAALPPWWYNHQVDNSIKFLQSHDVVGPLNPADQVKSLAYDGSVINGADTTRCDGWCMKVLLGRQYDLIERVRSSPAPSVVAPPDSVSGIGYQLTSNDNNCAVIVDQQAFEKSPLRKPGDCIITGNFEHPTADVLLLRPHSEAHPDGFGIHSFGRTLIAERRGSDLVWTHVATWVIYRKMRGVFFITLGWGGMPTPFLEQEVDDHFDATSLEKYQTSFFTTARSPLSPGSSWAASDAERLDFLNRILSDETYAAERKEAYAILATTIGSHTEYRDPLLARLRAMLSATSRVADDMKDIMALLKSADYGWKVEEVVFSVAPADVKASRNLLGAIETFEDEVLVRHAGRIVEYYETEPWRSGWDAVTRWRRLLDRVGEQRVYFK